MRPVVTLVVHAVVLVVGGLVAFLSAPEGAKATTALVVPGACAVVVLGVAALLGGRIGGEKGARIGRVAAPVLLVALTGLFAWRALAASAPDKAYLRTLLWALTAASAVAAVAVLAGLRRDRAAR
jgi:ABC-type xylose transport system permease subunit